MKTAVRYLPIVILAIAWEVVARLNLVDSLALPPLTKVAVARADLMRDGELIDNGASSLYRGGAGLLLAIVVGGGLGMAMARSRILDMFINPLVELFYPLPKSALIPVTVLWLGFGDGSKILLIFLGCMIPVTIGAYNGARGSDHALVWSARSMGAKNLRMIWDVVVPSALPELLNGIRTALALAFILLVSSELIVSQKGFGYLIGYLGSTGSYEGMYAVVLTIAFLGFAADRLYQLLMQRLLRWRESNVSPHWRRRRPRFRKTRCAASTIFSGAAPAFSRSFCCWSRGRFRPQRQGDDIHAAGVFRRRPAHLRRRRPRRSVDQSRPDHVPGADRLLHCRDRRHRARRTRCRAAGFCAGSSIR